jgi:hypothetical protein
MFLGPNNNHSQATVQVALNGYFCKKVKEVLIVILHGKEQVA